MLELYPYQQDAIGAARQAYREGVRSICLEAPTGSGKTVVASAICKGVAQRGQRTYFVVDNLELVGQSIDTFEKQGLTCGVVQGMTESDWTSDVMIMMAQTLAKRLKSQETQYLSVAPSVGVILIDECHVQHKAHKMLKDMHPNAFMIGLSATPLAKGMGLVYDRLIKVSDYASLVEMGKLSPFTLYSKPDNVDMKGAKTKANGDFSDKEADERVSDAVMGDAVQEYKRLAMGKKAIAFTARVARSRWLAEQFNQAGISARHVDGSGSTREEKEQRRQDIKDFRDGKYLVLCNVGITVKGFDVPDVECIVDLAPTLSIMKLLQSWGRGLRSHPGKETCIIIDHTGNRYRCGTPYQEMPDTLHDGETTSKSLDRQPREAPLPRDCVACGASKEPGVHKCPACGFAPLSREPIKAQPGMLVLDDGSIVEKDKHESNVWKAMNKSQKNDTMRMLKAIEKKNGYRNGWSIYAYRDIFGHEPAAKWVKPIEPSPELVRKVKSLLIRRAKSKGASHGIRT